MHSPITLLLSLPVSILLASAASAGPLPDALYASNFEAPPDCTSFGTPGCPGFSFEVPVSVPSGLVGAYCYYFRTPNASPLGVGRFSSRLGPLAGQVIVWTTTDNTGAPADAYPAGTLQACGDRDGGNGTNVHRIYQANAASEQLRMPSDDGTGTALALELPGNAAGFVQMFFVNPSMSSVSTRMTFAANGLATGAAYTKTSTYETYDSNISLSPFSTNTSVGKTCAVPPSVAFWWFSTHTHHYATEVKLTKGGTTILSTTDWQAPAIQSYAAPSFLTFGVGETLGYQCTYDNPTNRTVNAGPDFELDENCVAIGYFFPGDAPRLCYNGNLLP